jgi:hypothetical protein
MRSELYGIDCWVRPSGLDIGLRSVWSSTWTLWTGKSFLFVYMGGKCSFICFRCDPVVDDTFSFVEASEAVRVRMSTQT